MSLARLLRFIKATDKKILLNIGEIILEKQIGQGGNGIVFKCNFSSAQFAIKFLVTDATGKSKEQKIKRFVAEYVNVLLLNNLNSIVRYIDYDVLKITDEEGELELPVILMKLYDGSLSDLQQSRTFEGFKSVFDFLLKAIDYIHNNGIIHRDIKPENILYKGRQLSLADFGIASFNPEIFSIHADTKKGERIGNRLFSAPEQEENSKEAHPTMDIYAIGQVLQWFATKTTHRGTGRQPIFSFFNKEDKDEVKMYDFIIDKCLENNPSKRFQSIVEIKDFLRKYRKKGAYEYLKIFHEILVSNFPKSNSGLIQTGDIKRIDKLFQTFKDRENEFDNNLWWVSDPGSTAFQLKKTSEGVWRFNFEEHIIKQIWLYNHEGTFNDFILIHFVPGKPFAVEGKETFQTAIVNDKHHITYSEYENGWAEIDGDVIELAKHNVERIDRDNKEGYLFIGTRFSCILQYQNEDAIYKLIEKLKISHAITEEEILNFANEIRVHKNEEVEMGL